MLRYPGLYDATRAAAHARATALPHLTLRRDTVVYRNVPVGLGTGLLGAARARSIYRSEDNAKNRWTGRTPHGTPKTRGGVGGLYVTLDLDALIGEMFHYSLSTSVEEDMRAAAASPRDAAGRPTDPNVLTPQRLAEGLALRRIFSFTLLADVRVADLTLGGRGTTFLRSVWSDAGVQAAAGQTPYRTMLAACEASTDHSFARGIAQGLRDALPALAGIKVTSVRTEYETTLHMSGENIVFLGDDDQTVDVLVPEREISFVLKSGGGISQVTTWLHHAGIRPAAPRTLTTGTPAAVTPAVTFKRPAGRP